MAMYKTKTDPMPSDAVDSLDALIALHTLSVDTRLGFQKMADTAEPEFPPIAERFNALHGRQIARLNIMVREMGSLPDKNGSLMGTINVAVVGIRAALAAIDKGVTDQVRSGEQNVLAAFDRAAQVSLPQGHRDTLTQMKAELTGLLDETRHIG